MRAVISFLAAMVATAAYGDPIDGLWKTAEQDDGSYGYVQMGPCGDKICGVLVKGVDGQGVTATEGGNIGRQIVWDMVPQGDGSYGAGKIWAPDRDRTYASDMTLVENGLKVRGCVLGICRDGGIWTRAN